MGIFGKREDSLRSATALREFWAWWNNTGAAQCAAVGTDDTAAMAEALAIRVDAISDGLAWEIAGGSSSAHVLVVSPDGDPELRSIARRWLKAAPEANLVWSYADSRQPVSDLAGYGLQIAGRDVAVRDVVVGVRRRASRLDVSVYHPLMADLNDHEQMRLAFLALDAALGEEATETWIGELAPAQDAPLDGFGLSGLRATVRELREEFIDEAGEPTWLVLQGDTPYGPLVASTQVPLAAAWAPELDTHIGVSIPYADQDASGQPGPKSLGNLRALEDHVVARLEGQGRLVAHETTRGVRLLHLYVSRGTPAAEQVKAAVQAWDEGRVRVRAENDPGWAQVQHLRG
ncbi:DUF695 domain-containing protein [Leekyejoonella antrihumi]|nr:DUF695 domain-containing protein [Leekyejoonella antrihumi]